MISKILVPTDGSETAKKAIEYAVNISKQTGAAITFLNVIDKSFLVSQSMSAEATPTHVLESIEDYLQQAAETYLEEIKGLCEKNNVKSNTIIRSGHPVDKIVKEAEESKVDLIIMGSHGKRTIKAAILGSVSYGVIHKDTKIPVLIVKI